MPETEEEPMKPKQVEEAVVETEVLKASGGDDEKTPQLVSFKEESTKVADLLESEKKALREFKQLVQEALNKHEFSALTTPPAPAKEEEKNDVVAAAEEEKPAQEEETPVVIEDKENVEPQVVAEKEEKKEVAETEVLVNHEKVATAQTTVDDDGAKTVEAIEETIVAVSSSMASQEETSSQATKESEGETEAISALDEEAKEVKSETMEVTPEEVSIWGIPLLADDRSDVILLKFLRARDFKVKVAFTMLKNTIRWRKEVAIDELLEQDLGKAVFMQAKKELRQATRQALQLLQDNYPEFLAKQIFINVPWWYLTVNRMISPFLTQRTRSKFVFAGPSKSAETLLTRYIAAEQIPVKYGGLSKDGEFGTADAVTEITVKPSAKHTVEIPVTETCLLTWEMRVVGWDVHYGAEFVPSSEDSYTVIIQKARKVAATEGKGKGKEKGSTPISEAQPSGLSVYVSSRGVNFVGVYSP
ncbi:hypothetical protein OIU77_008125 [Salix suchowensis]|uniref:CRAL-TRIO domain-containing protein n=1 Tax=Salix suchowensis TaxID=1278906 RepID=A0ABQ9AIF6_9ROSI|nr:hypothetical protein OIU77_008125 [Salix suchowensis]